MNIVDILKSQLIGKFVKLDFGTFKDPEDSYCNFSIDHDEIGILNDSQLIKIESHFFEILDIDGDDYTDALYFVLKDFKNPGWGELESHMGFNYWTDFEIQDQQQDPEIVYQMIED